MRLTAEQVRQGLLHDDQGVRQQCLEYFTDMRSRDETVMPIVTQVIDARGRDAFEYFHRIDQLAQTDGTIEWLIRSLRQIRKFFADEMISDFRPRSRQCQRRTTRPASQRCVVGSSRKAGQDVGWDQRRFAAPATSHSRCCMVMGRRSKRACPTLR
jgi:hypothetical protein